MNFHPYYTAVALSLCFVLGILCVLIHENSRIDKQLKRRFYATYLIIIGAVLAEWAAIILNGAPSGTVTLHKWSKALDYILSPMAGAAFAHQVNPHESRKGVRAAIIGILAANAAFQIASVFTGWTFYMDEANCYRHGPLYAVYAAVFVIAFLYALTEFLKYGRKFRRKNTASLLLIFLFVSAELALQEIIGGEMRTFCVGLSVASCLLYIHYSEFSQLRQDDRLKLQAELLDTDALTGLRSRYAYTDTLNRMNTAPIPEDTVVFSVDINGLKTANDTLGHLAGDELIRGAADCIGRVLSPCGKCYRTGGDEFIAILTGSEESAEVLRNSLASQAAAWKGGIVPSLSLAVGVAFAKEAPGEPIEKLIQLADERMYQDKAGYYLANGIRQRWY